VELADTLALGASARKALRVRVPSSAHDIMTFLNPFVLFGLAAAAIPILIHLFNVRKLRTIEFSTLSFLKELNKNKIRRIKIRQWLLLALRTLLILLIVLAFSRPALQGNFGSAGTRAASTLVIIIDNSASMQLHNEQGTFLSQAQQKAMEIVATMQENDEVYFLRLSDLPLATTEEPTRDTKRLTDLIRDTEISYRHRTIEEGLRISARLMHQSKNFNKEIYVLTDGQSTTLSSPESQRTSEEQLFGPQVKIFYAQLSSRPGENISIERTNLPPSLLQAGKPLTLNVIVRNNGTSPVKNHLVTVTLDRNKVMQKSVSLNAGESATLDFVITPPRSGFLSGFAESEDDAFEPDNRSYFSLYIPAQVPVALVAAEPRYSQYLSAAINAAQQVNTKSPVTVTALLPSQITSNTLSQYSVMILSGVKELSAAQTEIVKQFVSTGGNLIFFPAADTGYVPYRYLTSVGVPDLRLIRSATSFDKVDLQFPIFQGMFEQGTKTKELSVESPRIMLSASPAAAAAFRPVISLSNGTSFLWLRESGRGKVLGVAVPATNDWSDLPLKGIFVPLLFQSILYLSSPAATMEEQSLFAGERLEFSSAVWKRNAAVSAASMKFFDTEQRIVPVQSYVKTSTEGPLHTMFSLDHADQPGMYCAVVNKDTAALLAVNIRREESRGELADEEQRDLLRKHLGIEDASFTMIQPDTNIQQTISESRFGIELWRYFLLFAVIVALIEMFVARESKQKSL
jgi:hypothetical protein